MLEITEFPFAPFRQALRAWYVREGRRLPWRESRDAYRVWISEIMLQQTTVAAVVPYFERFLQRFPTLEALAAAGEQDVLRQWEGLGYYSRARNIHKAAQALVGELDGAFPEDVEQLQELPGIGRYTAGAIASFAFDRRAPILEANTLRLHARLLGYEGDPRSTAGQRLLWEFAERVLPRSNVADFNQALMDLGATVCRPEPECSRCPVRQCCRALATGRQREIPQLASRPEVTEVVEVAVAVERNGAFLLRQRKAGERWAGLWDFVRLEGPKSGRVTSPWVVRSVAGQGLRVQVSERLPDIRHSVTRFRITLQCYRALWQEGELPGEVAWVRPAKFRELPFSKPGRKLAETLREKRLF